MYSRTLGDTAPLVRSAAWSPTSHDRPRLQTGRTDLDAFFTYDGYLIWSSPPSSMT